MIQFGIELRLMLLKGTPNVYPLIAPEKTKLPFIVYSRSSTEPVYARGKREGFNTSYEISIVDSLYESSLNVLLKVIDELDKNRDITITGLSESYTDDAFIQSLTININK